MLMARMEPENNIEMILDGYRASESLLEFIVIGNTNNTFGRYLEKKFSDDSRIHFIGSIFNQHHISNLIYFSNLYFHGHSVGGTNPSLLEAMGSRALIIAQDNIFNRTVLKENGYYFNTATDVCEYADTICKNARAEKMLAANVAVIEQEYSWKRIIDQYEAFFLQCKRNIPVPDLAPTSQLEGERDIFAPDL